MRKITFNHSNISGYTLLEVVIVIMIVGILAVTIVPNHTHLAVLTEYEARRVLNDIRYVQAMSMLSGQRYRWVITSSTSYQIVDASGSAMVLPDGKSTMTLASGLSFGALSNLPNSLVTFDALGVPYSSTGTPGTVLASTATIAIVSSTNTSNISIIPTTGFGYVS